jgi:hypothetical protein
MTTETMAKSRFEYGRHETFAVRHGWLGKGLERMDSSPDGFQADENAVVKLGLGSRMVKSLRYWLEASGIGELRAVETEGRKARELHTSSIGQVIYARDPYMEYPATWWFVHLNLARRSGSVWGWFFNDFRERMFDRATCVDAYLRYLRLNASNEPTLSAAQRDVACLLSAYSAASANEPRDPEDGTASPLRDLGLVLRHEDTGRFEKTRPLDEVPIEVFLACVAAEAEDLQQETLSMGDLLGRRGGPGVVLGLTGDSIEDLAARAAQDFAKLGVTLDLLGAERRLRVPMMAGMHFWLDRHFQRVGGDA